MALPKVDKKREPKISLDDELLDYLKPPKKRLTPSEVIDAGLLGGWKDREDIGDTVEFVQKIRGRTWDESR